MGLDRTSGCTSQLMRRSYRPSLLKLVQFDNAAVVHYALVSLYLRRFLGRRSPIWNAVASVPAHAGANANRHKFSDAQS
jgi:hypothetical protein